ncbi:MAG: hypothetical protein ABL899_00910 [Nitrospira sp.]
MDFVSKIKALNLPSGKYIVFGSGVMEIHGIRKAKDVDVLINEELYDELKKRGWKRKWFFKRVLTCKALTNENNEAFTNLLWKDYKKATDDVIKKAEIIDGIPFMSLVDYVEYKKHLPRKKDKDDVVLIEKYLTNNKK